MTSTQAKTLGPNASVRQAEAISPNDDTQLVPVPRGVYVGGAGNLKVDLVDGGTVTYTNVPAGTTLMISPIKVYATGTTATNLVSQI